LRIFFALICSFSLALAARESGVVTATDDTRIQAEIAGAQKGMSAIILRRYEGGEIISRHCTVTRAGASRADLACEPFELFQQAALPGIELAVKPGDRVILRPLGGSATIIAPNATRYVRVLDRFSREHRFIHPDLLAYELRLEKTPAPTRKEMQRFCDRQMVGTLIFALDDGDYLLDCQSFATLEYRADTPPKAEAMSPFFHRLDPIKRGFFSWGTPGKIRDFDRYYRDFVTKDFDAQ
jgi:hypothetical protein